MGIDNKKISELTVGEFKSLVETLLSTSAIIYRNVYGLKGLADLFGVSLSTAKRIKASGVINAAISQSGRTIVIDADKALNLYNKSTHANRFKNYTL